MSPNSDFNDRKRTQQRLDRAYAQAREPLPRDAVAEIVRGMLTSLSGDMSMEDIRLYRELEGLARYVHHTRAELAALSPGEITGQHIPTATDELDAVVGATESATFQIFDACDAIGGIAGALEGDVKDRLNEQVTRIFEACNFQDITGQRITKVVKALKAIETKIDALVAAFGEDVRFSGVVAETPAETPADSDSALLHGPQMPGEAISQDEIDRLLASFD